MPTLSILEGSGGNYRTQSQSLFRQPYHYAEDATGLVGVPIPVWSTQSFLGSWNARVPKNLLTVAEGNKELVRPVDVDLKKGRGGGGDALTGKIDNHLPVTLEGLCLFYRGKWYALNQSLGPGERYRVNIQFQGGGKGKAFADWFSPITSRELLWSTPTNAPLRPKMLAHPTVQNITEKADLPYSAFREIKALMFYEVWGNQKKWANSRLRNLDQSWRIEKQVDLQRKASYRDEAILVARTTLYDDRAEKITSESAAGTRLWLKKLPGGEEENTRPELPGKMSQETYIRVYIPVK